jgi:hypothetical protein
MAVAVAVEMEWHVNPAGGWSGAERPTGEDMAQIRTPQRHATAVTATSPPDTALAARV